MSKQPALSPPNNMPGTTTFFTTTVVKKVVVPGMRRPGFSVIEVIIALGMATVVIATVGNLVGATHRLTSSSGKELQATAYAKQWIEIMSSQVNSTFVNKGFGCTCAPANPCPGAGTCTNVGQTCTPRPGFNSCWEAAPISLNLATLFKLVPSGSNFDLRSADGINNCVGDCNPDVTSDGFTRKMTIVNLWRDNTSQALVAAGSPNAAEDKNSKKISVTVSWRDGARNPQKEFSTILTAWKNF